MHSEDIEKTVSFIRDKFNNENEIIPLHEPKFIGNEKEYILNALDSSYVSSIGQYVNQFEDLICEYTGSEYVVATINGTSALDIALLVASLEPGDEVITQPLTFIATVNAIHYTSARPLFLDVDLDTMGLSPGILYDFLKKQLIHKNGKWINKITGKKVSACVPVNTFRFPCKIDEITEICSGFDIPVVEDAAESLGSFYENVHTRTFGESGIFSFNGNKIVTSGGGGMLITNDENITVLAKHLSTTAKLDHPWNYDHDMVGFNYRLPNLNASLICAQLEQIEMFVENKRSLAKEYENFFSSLNIKFRRENENSRASYWLMSIELENINERDSFLSHTNNAKINTHPIWNLMTDLPMYSTCQKGDLSNSQYLSEQIINIPSSVII
jgi:aminotransferase in exopolysaccharide biosynthesis